MNNVTIIIYFIFSIGLLSCVITDNNSSKNTSDLKQNKDDEKNIIKISQDKSVFSIDSLCNINLFDFYGKTLKVLLSNNIINQYSIYDPIIDKRGCIKHIELGYNSRDLVIHFSNFNKNAYCGDPNERIIENLLDEKILFVRFTHQYLTPLTDSEKEDEVFIDALKQVDFSYYYNMPIDSLMSNLPKPRRSPIISLDGIDGCLDKATLSYRLKTHSFGIMLYTENLEYTPRCLDLEIEHWNFNDFRKEILKEVKILGL